VADDRKNEAINAERSGAFYADASASFFDGQSVVRPSEERSDESGQTTDWKPPPGLALGLSWPKLLTIQGVRRCKTPDRAVGLQPLVSRSFSQEFDSFHRFDYFTFISHDIQCLDCALNAEVVLIQIISTFLAHLGVDAIANANVWNEGDIQ
jgi:hypothetical protein